MFGDPVSRLTKKQYVPSIELVCLMHPTEHARHSH